MKAILDDKRRATMPPEFSPGDVFDLEITSPGVVMARLMKPAEKPRAGRGLLGALKSCPHPLPEVPRHKLPSR